MDHFGSQSICNSELQALIAALPHELSIASPVATTKSASSIGDISSTSSSCIFPPLNDTAALSMISLSAHFPLISGFPAMPSLQYFNTLPPHIESLGLINSSMYNQQNRDYQSSFCSPTSSSSINPYQYTNDDGSRPRAFSSAATLQNIRPVNENDRRRKRSRKVEEYVPTTTVISCSETTPSSTILTSNTVASFSNQNNDSSKKNNEAPSSLLRSLVMEDDVHPNKIRQIVVTKEEEELVRKKTQEILEKVPILPEESESFTASGHRPLRRLIRDEDLPDEVGPDSPFRHYPKYQVQNRNQMTNRL